MTTKTPTRNIENNMCQVQVPHSTHSSVKEGIQVPGRQRDNKTNVNRLP
jgi:hypothetical protein